jgi:hypothetical protein
MEKYFLFDYVHLFLVIKLFFTDLNFFFRETFIRQSSVQKYRLRKTMITACLTVGLVFGAVQYSYAEGVWFGTTNRIIASFSWNSQCQVRVEYSYYFLGIRINTWTEDISCAEAGDKGYEI